MELEALEKVDASCVCAMGKRHWGKGEGSGV